MISLWLQLLKGHLSLALFLLFLRQDGVRENGGGGDREEQKGESGTTQQVGAEAFPSESEARGAQAAYFLAVRRE